MFHAIGVGSSCMNKLSARGVNEIAINDMTGAKFHLLSEAADIDEEMRVRFWVHGTGHPFVHNWSNTPHVGTITTHDNALVWHVYAEYPLEEKIAGGAA